jgi:hypothetical protein
MAASGIFMKPRAGGGKGRRPNQLKTPIRYHVKPTWGIYVPSWEGWGRNCNAVSTPFLLESCSSDADCRAFRRNCHFQSLINWQWGKQKRLNCILAKLYKCPPMSLGSLDTIIIILHYHYIILYFYYFILCVLLLHNNYYYLRQMNSSLCALASLYLFNGGIIRIYHIGYSHRLNVLK